MNERHQNGIEGNVENSLKQRIIGAIVLIALAVIFLPSILKEKEKQAPFQSQIPPKPVKIVEYQLTEQAKQQNLQVKQQLDSLVNREGQIAKLKQEELASGDDGTLLSTEQTATSTSTSEPQTESIGESRKKPISDSSADTNTSLAEKIPATTANLNSASSKPTSQQSAPKSNNFQQSGWVIQVASFTSETNAKNLVTKLKAAEFKAYRRVFTNAQGKSVYRVYTGPYAEQEQASGHLKTIEKITRTKGLVKSYDPLKH
ncbi:SPOR domain-containing protein [Aliikangiella maris]|uniref:SPOR domain-containing protein n=2 Tax=Aliikangiella maris TaxID=3162458 RepID=A0ABV2BUI7_9GAMM